MVDQPYVWVKAFHIIFVISWMAGMLYLPRLFVYHADASKDSQASEMLKIMERRLLRFIMTPAMILAFISGIALVMMSDAMHEGWFHAKLGLVIMLSAYHGLLARWRKDFERDANTKTAKFYRIINEVPTVLMILIVIMVVVKPL